MTTKPTLHLIRVFYGKDSTPKNKREYRVMGMFSGPVGTKSEWAQWALANGFGRVVIKELTEVQKERIKAIDKGWYAQ